PEDQEKRGKALLRLSLFEMHYTPAGQRLITFGFANDRWLPRYTLGVGDVVALSAVDVPPAGRPIGTVYEKTRKEITVAFNVKIPSWVGRASQYALAKAENKTTFDRMYEAVKTVGQAPHGRLAHLRNLSLGLKRPGQRDAVPESKLNYFNPALNAQQKWAVCKAFEAEEVFLLHGPPGTGKTSVLIEMIRQAHAQGQSVLVSAPSNAACDHVLDCLVRAGESVTRLGHPARMKPALRDHTFSFQLAAHPLAKMIDDHSAKLERLLTQKERKDERGALSREDSRELWDEINFLRDDIRKLRAEIFQQVWKSSDIVVATHTVCGDPLIRAKTFDWVVIDEATQAIEPATWIPAMAAGKLILAGDHCQLPPTVFSPRRGPDSFHHTLFERFHEHLEAGAKLRLETQYRMHEKIMGFSSREFYEGKLIADDSAKNRVLADLPGVKDSELTRLPFVFLDTAGLGYEENLEEGTSSRTNEQEALLAVKLYRQLLEAGVQAADIALISPYSAQVKLLASLILQERDDSDSAAVAEINSIDSFQGREKEAVIVSLVRSNLTGEMGFLADTRRMNVALTRAKRKLIVIGDSATISSIPFYEDFIRYAESVEGYLSAWEFAQ
ncbi:MAG: hypothetical protein A2Y02_00215, partial [Omnitrophica bacterium GWA2_52_12]